MSTHARDIRDQNPVDRTTNRQKTNKYASCPDWRISPHADHRHHSCERYFWQCNRNLCAFYRMALYSIGLQRIWSEPDLRLQLWLGPAPGLDQSSPKGEMTWRTPRSTILQNFIALSQPTPEISVTTLPKSCRKQTKKQTVNNISPTCLSADADNK